MSEKITKQIEDIDQQLAELKKKLQNPAAVKDAKKDNAAATELFDKKFKRACWIADFDADVDKDARQPAEIFSKSHASGSEENEFQKDSDRIYLASRLMKTFPHDLRAWGPFAEKHAKFIKAMDTATAGEGAEWFPTEMSARLTQLVELDLKVARLFPRITMPRKTFELPTMSSLVEAQKLSESLVDVENATAIPTAKPTTAKATLTAKKLGIRMNWSMELEEESIFPLVPMLEDQASKSISRAIETALINGDTAVTHQDAGIGATSAETTWDGLRKRTKSANKFNLGTMSVDNLLQLIAALGKYGSEVSDSAFITSPAGWVQLMKMKDAANRQVLVTMDTGGETFGLKSGKIDILFGRPVIVSEKVKTTLDTNGVVPATPGTKTQIILTHRNTFVLGDRRAIKVGTRVWIDTDQRIIVSTWRGDFTNHFDTAVEDVVALGNNVSTT